MPIVAVSTCISYQDMADVADVWSAVDRYNKAHGDIKRYLPDKRLIKVHPKCRTMPAGAESYVEIEMSDQGPATRS